MKKQVYHLKQQHDPFLVVNPKESDTPVIFEIILCVVLFPAIVPVLVFAGFKWLCLKVFS